MVLLDNYTTFATEADRIDNWRTASKNDLCNEYIAYEFTNPELAQSYYCAIICRYWPLISKYYYQHKEVFSLEDCYDWLLHSIDYAFKHRKWLDPSSKIYGDPAGPDKIINRAMFSTCLTEYQRINKEKRRSNLFLSSLDKFEEDFGDALYNILGDDYIEFLELDNPYGYLIINAFSKKEYLMAFMLDAILQQDTFRNIEFADGVYCVFDEKKLIKHLRNLDDKAAKIFSARYNINLDSVKDSLHYITELSTPRLRKRVRNNLILLKKTLDKDSLLNR